ncbi:MAG: MFS transporter [Oscillospiraceae bacterium]|nr:MFS transporter [Oscillospiraceae bacterium]
MKQTLWTKDFTILILATILGSAGGITGGFALSLLVYDETGSTFAAALLIAIQIIPDFLIPLSVAPIMDRMKRKPVLVAGDAINGILYMLCGIYLLHFRFSYIGYLVFSLIISSLGSFDRLAYNSIFPKLIPKGMEEKGYTVSSMIYPVLQVIMMPAAAWLVSRIGVPMILILQGILSIIAALLESGIKLKEHIAAANKGYSLSDWFYDLKDGLFYLRKEPGLLRIYTYMAITNGVGNGYSPILTAFFRTAQGFTVAMYSFFSAAEFIGRTLGGIVHYHLQIPPRKRHGFAFFVYCVYETMDMILLWLPYPFMLLNRGICGFLGINSASMRQAAVQRYLKEEYRARVNAFESVLSSAFAASFSLIIGLMGEILDLRVCITVFAAITMLSCILLIGLGSNDVRQIYEYGE